MENDISPRSRRRAQNRIYCRENRRKKKEYVNELESKIDFLEGEIVRLNNQIDKYRHKLNIVVIGEEKDFGEYTELQECRRQNAIKSLEEGRDKEELKKNISDFAKFAGCVSNDRQRLIKAAFRVVIDNLVPNRVRVLLNLTNVQNELDLAAVKRLFRMNKQQFEVEMKDPRYCEIDRLHYYMGLDAEAHYKVRKTCKEFDAIKRGFEKCIHTLIKTRNKILNLQMRFKK